MLSGYRRPVGWHPIALLAVLALWLATLGNVPLWLKLAQMPDLQGPARWPLMLAWALALWAGTLAFAGLWVWPRQAGGGGASPCARYPDASW